MALRPRRLPETSAAGADDFLEVVAAGATVVAAPMIDALVAKLTELVVDAVAF